MNKNYEKRLNLNLNKGEKRESIIYDSMFLSIVSPLEYIYG